MSNLLYTMFALLSLHTVFIPTRILSESEHRNFFKASIFDPSLLEKIFDNSLSLVA